MNILDLYNEVFDKAGNIKNCRREKCKSLMRECEKATGKEGNFGDMDTGMMNIKAVKNVSTPSKGSNYSLFFIYFCQIQSVKVN